VTVHNTGNVRGSEVIQLYVTYPDQGITHPSLQLRGFVKAKDLQPGESRTVQIALDKHAISYWDTPTAKWRAEQGKYEAKVGHNSKDLPLVASFELGRSFAWSGL
jgi:beta-glucosidase